MITLYTHEQVSDKFIAGIIDQGVGDVERGIPSDVRDLVHAQVSFLLDIQRKVRFRELPLLGVITTQPDFQKYMDTRILLMAEAFAKLIQVP
jgi:hypothetical protein